MTPPSGRCSSSPALPDEALPPDLAVTGAISQHLLASPAKAREVLGWRATADPQVLRRAVA